MTYNTQIIAYFMHKPLLIRDGPFGRHITTLLYQELIVNIGKSTSKIVPKTYLCKAKLMQSLCKSFAFANKAVAKAKLLHKLCSALHTQQYGLHKLVLTKRSFVLLRFCNRCSCKSFAFVCKTKFCKSLANTAKQSFACVRTKVLSSLSFFASTSFALLLKALFLYKLRFASTSIQFYTCKAKLMCTKAKAVLTKNKVGAYKSCACKSSAFAQQSEALLAKQCFVFGAQRVPKEMQKRSSRTKLRFGEQSNSFERNALMDKVDLKVSLLSQQTSSNCTGIDDKVTRTIVITSGKGGVGKTTTTANLGMSIARLGYRVTLIDADIGLRNLDLLLGLENRVLYTAMDIFEGDCRLDQALIRDKRLKNLCLLAISKNRQRYNVTRQKMDSLISSICALGSDFILIDCPAGIDIGFINAISPAQEALIITTPEITAMRDADRVAGLLEANGIYNAKLLINRVRPDMIQRHDMMSVQDVQDVLGIPLLGAIPEDLNVIISTNRGEPLVLSKKLSLSGVAFENAARRLVGKQEYLIDLKSPYKNIFHKMKALLFNA